MLYEREGLFGSKDKETKATRIKNILIKKQKKITITSVGRRRRSSSLSYKGGGGGKVFYK